MRRLTQFITAWRYWRDRQLAFSWRGAWRAAWRAQ